MVQLELWVTLGERVSVEEELRFVWENDVCLCLKTDFAANMDYLHASNPRMQSRDLQESCSEYVLEIGVEMSAESSFIW